MSTSFWSRDLSYTLPTWKFITTRKNKTEQSIQWYANDMESLMPIDARLQLDRFCHQYLQVQRDLEYPSSEYLRQYEFQQIIYNRLFSEKAIKHAPPARYRLRVLKELLARIETSIVDFEEEVGITIHLSTFEYSLM
jgi:hypothetical protein